MKQHGAPFDASEPPHGDFIRYIEALNAIAEARVRAEAVDFPSPGEPLSPAQAPPAQAASERPVQDLEAMRQMMLARAGGTLRRAATWMLLAGIALILLAVVPDEPFIDTPLPGILLAGASLALRQRFRKA